jgi:UDP-glucose 6-dehydrogenase
MSAEFQVFGMAMVAHSDRVREAHPISAVTVLKLMDAEGKIFFVTTTTEDVCLVEAAGMLEFAQKRIYARL